jgi:hypothetical protein
MINNPYLYHNHFYNELKTNSKQSGMENINKKQVPSFIILFSIKAYASSSSMSSFEKKTYNNM